MVLEVIVTIFLQRYSLFFCHIRMIYIVLVYIIICVVVLFNDFIVKWDC